MKRAVFPGSFDPLTLGHQDIVERGATIFDEIIVGIGHNAEKKHMFSINERKQFITQCFLDNPKIKVMDYQGLTIDFCKSVGANYLLRGVRNNGDFEFDIFQEAGRVPSNTRHISKGITYRKELALSNYSTNSGSKLSPLQLKSLYIYPI